MPQADRSINAENRITPLAPACALPTLNLPLMATATRSPPPMNTAIAAAIFRAQGRSPGASGVSVARMAALRASVRLGGADGGAVAVGAAAVGVASTVGAAVAVGVAAVVGAATAVGVPGPSVGGWRRAAGRGLRLRWGHPHPPPGR